MNSKRIRLFLIILLALLYNLFFWKQRLGLNVLLFSLSLMGSLLMLSPEARNVKTVWLTGVGTFLTGLLVVWHNSLLAFWVHFLSLLIFAGFVHRPQLTTVFHALQSIARSYLTVIINVYRRARIGYYRGKLLKKIGEIINVSALPAAIIIPLIFLFALTNPRFEYSLKALLGGVFTIAGSMGPDRILFFTMGLLLVGGMISGCGMNAMLNRRRKNKLQQPLKTPSQSKNKQFYDTWVIISWIVNGLLVLFNLSEIIWLWTGNNAEELVMDRDLLFQALLLLIFVITASIITLLIVFRKPERFSKIKGNLHNLAFFWVFQCLLILASICIRVFNYIEVGGLSYNRLLVVLLIGLTLCSLLSMGVMLIHQQGSKQFFRLSYWMAYSLLVGACFFNWDSIIAKYNLDLSREKQVEVVHLLDLSDKTLPVLLKNSKLPEFPNSEYVPFYEGLTIKVRDFHSNYPQRGWLGWNRADYRSYKYLDRKGTEEIEHYLQYQQKAAKWMEEQRR